MRCTRENGISTIEFFHPLSNSMPGYLLKELTDTIRNENTANTRVIVLKSGGPKAFCAGASFNELIAVSNKEEGLAFFSGFANVINAMRESHKLIVVRVQGKCVGGGVGIVSAADYAIAVSGADIKLSELALGIGPFVIGPSVERKIGVSGFSELAIDAASWRSAEWAHQKGLFNKVCNTAEELDESVRQLAVTLSHYSPKAMADMKKVFWEGTDHWETLLKERAAISGKLILTDYAKNAIEKIRKK